jgi:hypothetical protein
MDPVKLGALLVKRIAANRADLDFDVMAGFIGAAPSTIASWIFPNRPAGPPKGERLNRLWHFLAAVGVESPELERLPAFHRYVGELHAFGIVALANNDDRAADELTILELLGLKTEQSALRTMRGDQKPVNPLFGKVEGESTLDISELVANYNDQLLAAKQQLKEQLAESQQPVTRIPEREVASVTLPATVTLPTTAPIMDEPTSSVVQLRPQATAAPEPEPSDEFTIEHPSEPTMEAVPALAAEPPASQVASNHKQQIMGLTSNLSGLMPLLRWLNSEHCTDADRAYMRLLFGPEVLLELRMIFVSLTSTRARQGK